ncbi:MAG: TonB-dependent receptor [bacterium]
MTKKISSLFCILFLFQLFFCLTLFSQNYGTIRGRVVDSKENKPIFGVNILIQGTVIGTTTDDRGTFEIENVPPGVYTMLVSHIGYENKTFQSIMITPGTVVGLDIELKESVVEMDPVIVSATKHPQSLSSSHQAVEVIPHTRIQEMQYTEAYKSLSNVPGIHFNEQNISIRGSSGYSVFNVGSRILVMIDGIPVNSSDLGAINWDILPLLDIKRIEVVKGAGSALYGSSAMGGVVNIITKEPSGNNQLLLRTRAGIYDKPAYKEWHWTDDILHFEDINASFSGGFGPVDVRLSFARYLSTGYMENNHMDRWNGSLRLKTEFSNKSHLNVYASWMKSREGGLIQWLNQNSPFEVPPFNKEDEIKFSTVNIALLYSWPISSKLGMKFRTSFLSSYMSNQLTAYNPGAFQPAYGPGGEIQCIWLPDSRNQITFGTEFRADISSTEYFGEHKGHSASLYCQDEIVVSPFLKTTLGFRIDKHVLDSKSLDIQFSPKAGVNVQLFPGTNLRSTAGKGFRAATVFERFVKADYAGFNIIPNPDLNPERSWFWDVGIIQDFSSTSNFQLSYFYSEYKNMIEPVIDFLGTIQFQNYLQARIQGIEISEKLFLFSELVGLTSTFTILDPVNVITAKTLPYRPRFTANCTATIRFKKFFLQTEYKYFSRIEEVEINPLDPRVPVKLLNVRAHYTLGKFTIQAAVMNCLNYHFTYVERRMGEVRKLSLGLIYNSSR